MPTLKIDGRTVSVESGDTILQAAQRIGVEIPTLCHHPSLEAWGGCRLCLVDVTHPDWEGWSKVVVSCMAAAEDGLVVDTASERVKEARRVAFELLLARCPNTPAVRSLAAANGVTETPFVSNAEPTDCVLCGLCTRVCEAHATSAITTWGRGTDKAVGPFMDAPPADCVGCGACAQLCPTGHIQARAEGARYQIWGRTFTAQPCTVAPAKCIGCGACVEACPFSVARIQWRVGQTAVAVVPVEHCRGCGVCAGVCPTGAIEQADCRLAAAVHTPSPREAAAELMVVACPRCGLSAENLPAGVGLVTPPCVGRLSFGELLALSIRARRGVLVLGRNQETCRFAGAEDVTAELVERVNRALALAGCSAPGVTMLDARPGPRGALETVVAHWQRGPRLELEAPVRSVAPVSGQCTGVDPALAMLDQLTAFSDSARHSEDWLTSRGLPGPGVGPDALFVGGLPLVDQVLGALPRPVHLPDVFRAALHVLRALGVGPVGIVVDRWADQPLVQRDRLARAPVVWTLSRGDKDRLSVTGFSCVAIEELIWERRANLAGQWSDAVVACAGDPTQVDLLEGLGLRPLVLGPDPLPAGFSWSAEPLQRAEAQLRTAEQGGATVMLVSDPLALLRWALLTRRGRWRTSRVMPVLPHQLAWLALTEQPLSASALLRALTDVPDPGGDLS